MKFCDWMDRQAENGNIQYQVEGRDGHEEARIIQDGGRWVMRYTPICVNRPLLEQLPLVILSMS